MRKYFYVIAIILIAKNMHGQQNVSATFMERVENISFNLHVDHVRLTKHETLNIHFLINNEDSARSVVIFKPRQFLRPDSVGWYIIDNGGFWYVELGHVQPISLISISPKQSYDFDYKIAIDTLSKREKEKAYSLTSTGDYASETSRYILIYIGYYIDDGFFKDINFSYLSGNGFAEDKAIQFEQKLKRLILGPIRIETE